MIDFACREFDLDEIIKCSLGLTKAEYNILIKALEYKEEYFTAEELSKKIGLNLSTVQRAVKKLHEEKVLERKQNNLEGGGYIYIYKVIPRNELRKLLMKTIYNWTKRVETEINKW